MSGKGVRVQSRTGMCEGKPHIHGVLGLLFVEMSLVAWRCVLPVGTRISCVVIMCYCCSDCNPFQWERIRVRVSLQSRLKLHINIPLELHGKNLCDKCAVLTRRTIIIIIAQDEQAACGFNSNSPHRYFH